MAKIIDHQNIRVEVYPSLGWQTKSAKEQFSICKNLEKEIIRHVDNIENSVVTSDSKEICEFCRLSWETETDGTPICCEKAITEFEQDKINLSYYNAKD